MPNDAPVRDIKLESEKQSVADAINFFKIAADRPPPDRTPKDPGPTVADELNARLAMVQLRPDHAKRIPRLVKTNVPEPQHLYRFFCVCPRYHPCYVPCQHTGQIIIDRDMLKREEHICFLATPKKDFLSPLRMRQPRYITKKIYVPICTARVERLAVPHPLRVRGTWEDFRHILNKRHRQALQDQMKPKPPVETLTMEKAMEYLEEEMRQRRAAKLQHKKRCKNLKKLILERQRKQMIKIVCVLFEEMKDFLLNDQFIIDEQSPLCAVILDRIKEFTEQEFYTTSNLREYQRILANNLTVWINKFISNLNIYLAPQEVPVERTMHGEYPETFVPLSDFISLSEHHGEEMGGTDFDYDLSEFEGMNESINDYLRDNDNELINLPGEMLPSEETII
ncbi:Rcd7 [Drosophila busckii]|uniref:Rcd7 n=1 Tax=Drosophila busckii TaxID=30019 RepID=A0A0M4F0Q8_DROBS|nr:Rcd7 [Drosophila busckii]